MLQKTRAILLLILVISASSCVQNNSEWDTYVQLRMDSLQNIASQMPTQLKFTLPELEEIQTNITDDLELLKHAAVSKINKEDDVYANQYLQLLPLINKTIPEYKQAIAAMEESILLFKQLKKSVEQKNYQSKKEEFKKEYTFLKNKLLRDAELIDEAGSMTSHIHVSYIRLQPKIEKLILKSVDESTLPTE